MITHFSALFQGLFESLANNLIAEDSRRDRCVQGINVTLGLPILRTSVDHGTAFDIAGKGLADPGAMIAAIRMAGEAATRRAKIVATAK